MWSASWHRKAISVSTGQAVAVCPKPTMPNYNMISHRQRQIHEQPHTVVLIVQERICSRCWFRPEKVPNPFPLNRQKPKKSNSRLCKPTPPTPSLLNSLTLPPPLLLLAPPHPPHLHLQPREAHRPLPRFPLLSQTLLLPRPEDPRSHECFDSWKNREAHECGNNDAAQWREDPQEDGGGIGDAGVGDVGVAGGGALLHVEGVGHLDGGLGCVWGVWFKGRGVVVWCSLVGNAFLA